MNAPSAALRDDDDRARWALRLDGWSPEPDAGVAGWLQEPGLLTLRLRACCAGNPGLRIVAERRAPLTEADARLLHCGGGEAFVREIELTCDGHAWVFAQTLVPAATLARHGWLAGLGGSALGERLSSVPGLRRGPLEFSRLLPDRPLFARAWRGGGPAPAALWARRSWFDLDGDRLLVQEVFLPGVSG